MKRNKGFTLIEILVAMTILLFGILALARLFPVSLRANTDGQNTIRAAFLAQQKVEELRRDHDDFTNPVIGIIRTLTQPQPPVDQAIPFANNPGFSYVFCGRSLIYPDGTDPNNPDDDYNVARVIVLWDDGNKMFEMRFAE